MLLKLQRNASSNLEAPGGVEPRFNWREGDRGLPRYSERNEKESGRSLPILILSVRRRSMVVDFSLKRAGSGAGWAESMLPTQKTRDNQPACSGGMPVWRASICDLRKSLLLSTACGSVGEIDR